VLTSSPTRGTFRGYWRRRESFNLSALVGIPLAESATIQSDGARRHSKGDLTWWPSHVLATTAIRVAGGSCPRVNPRKSLTLWGRIPLREATRFHALDSSTPAWKIKARFARFATELRSASAKPLQLSTKMQLRHPERGVKVALAHPRTKRRRPPTGRSLATMLWNLGCAAKRQRKPLPPAGYHPAGQ
jgi:hypothetical protein